MNTDNKKEYYDPIAELLLCAMFCDRSSGSDTAKISLSTIAASVIKTLENYAEAKNHASISALN